MLLHERVHLGLLWIPPLFFALSILLAASQLSHEFTEWVLVPAAFFVFPFALGWSPALPLAALLTASAGGWAFGVRAEFRRSGWKSITSLVLLVPVLAMALVKFDVPLWMTFAMSRAELEQLIEKKNLYPIGHHGLHRRVGLVEVESLNTDFFGGVSFQWKSADSLWPNASLTARGFAWNPDRLPERSYFPAGTFAWKELRGFSGWYCYTITPDED